jgi:alpha-L-rhamnosidase
LLGVVLLPARSAETPPAASQLDEVRRGFENPPDNSRIMMRWWWFGPAVTKPELEREIRAMKAAGIGGFEVAPVYPMTLDDPEHGIVNLPYLSPGFLDALHFAAQTANRLGMRFDLNLGCGWPYGGPNTPVTQASGSLRVVKTSPPGGATSLPLPSLSVGESLLAAFLVRPDAASWKDIRRLPIDAVLGGRLALPEALPDARMVVFFIASRTGMMVKRPAVNGEGFVLDHLDHAAVENHLKKVADPMMEALADDPPYSVFSDSLEVYGAAWTPKLVKEFRKRRGYDIIPHLRALAGDAGPETYDVRYDWGRTMTELLEENYLQQLRAWAHQHHTKFRAQVYGPPGATLSSNAYADLPEGEGANWRGFSPIRWAASANHLSGQSITSSESFTWTHSLPFGATPLDLKAEADVDFLEGSNQLIGHGWPYSPPYAAAPGWTLYAAGALDDANPWWIVMPDVSSYMQRVSYLLRQGSPVNNVALLLPTEDAWARAAPGPRIPNDLIESISDVIDGLLGKDVTGQIVDAGFNLDYVDSRMIDKSDIRHRILILPCITGIPLHTYQKIEAFAEQGGMVIATRTLPSRAPGLASAQADSAKVREISKRLFQSTSARGRFVPNELLLSSVLKKVSAPDLSLSSPSPAIGFVHRHMSDGSDIYFVANTTNQTVRRLATFRPPAKHREVWDPFSGQAASIGDGSSVELDLASYESKIISFSVHSPAPGEQAPESGVHTPSTSQFVDLSKEWNVTIPSRHYSTQMHSHAFMDRRERHALLLGRGSLRERCRPAPFLLQSGRKALSGFRSRDPSHRKTAERWHARVD